MKSQMPLITLTADEALGEIWAVINGADDSIAPEDNNAIVDRIIAMQKELEVSRQPSVMTIFVEKCTSGTFLSGVNSD